MKLKIVIKVPIHSEKDVSKAMQIVVAEEGVISVKIVKDKDEVEVIGEGVDSVCLAKSLRKKFCFADIVSVGEVKPPKKDPSPCLWPPCPPPPCYFPPPSHHGFYDPGPPNCTIM